MLQHSSDQFLELVLLGGFEVRLNGNTVTGFSYNKMRALFAYLAIEREQDHNREALAALFWKDNDPTTARDNLRRTLSNLRRVLEIPSGLVLFSAGKHTIRFIPNIHIDALHFTGNAQTAGNEASVLGDEARISLYRGEFMAGFSLPDCPDFEEWLAMQREILHRRALALLEHLSKSHEKLGDYAGSLQFTMRHIELEPWNEHIHRRAMRLYSLNGQDSAAIDQYETCCRMLKEELGLLPDNETRQLALNIQRGKADLKSHETVQIPQPGIQPVERRQVTVLSCELSMTATDDPEDAMELLHAPQTQCIEIIGQLSGHIVQAHGGGLLAYFGYPKAHENAARRAVHAALAIANIATFGIEIRASVHSGIIITGTDTSIPDTVGKTTKGAIELRKHAAPGEVTISSVTHRIVDGYFDCTSRGMQSLPGFTAAIETFSVTGDSGAYTRLDAASRLTPMVGRHAEIGNLLKLWKEVAQGVRHVVLIQGEAGIGKSRLLYTLKERLVGSAHVVRELRCFPEFSHSPFYPLIAMLEALFGFAGGDTQDAKSAKLVQYLESRHPALVADAQPLLAKLLCLPPAAPYVAVSAQKQKEQTITILLDLLDELAVKLPTLLIVEDLHWIDPSSLELLSRFVERTTGKPVLAVLTARPEFDPPWDESLESTLMLLPLAKDDIVKIIASISENMPEAIIHRIVERVDGVPLFAEEMAKLNDLKCIPDTLQDLLAARMDSMGDAKYAAQLAATIGREFNLDLLRKVSPYDTATLTYNLSALQDAGLILTIDNANCQFRHALIQEAAYQSQSRTDRQAAHRRIAKILSSDFPDIVAMQPEAIAQHYASSGDSRSAIEYWIKAGQRALQGSANQEAIQHFDNGLQQLNSLAPDNERAVLEAELLINLGAALIAAKGYGSSEAGDAYSRALTLCEQLDERSGLYKALWGMWLTSSSRIDHAHSLELAERLLLLARQSHDPLQLQPAYYAMGNSLLWTGQLQRARDHQEQAIALYQPSHHEVMVKEFGENIRVSCGSQLAWVLWLQGYSNQAQIVSDQTLTLAQQINHPYSLGYAMSHRIALGRWLGQVETTRQQSEETMAMANRYGFPVWLLSGMAVHGWAQAMQGQASGIEHMQHAVNIVRAAMSGIEAYFLGLLAEAHMHLGQFEQSLSALNLTLDVIAAKDDRFLHSETLRLKGECLLKLSASSMSEAEACFTQALAISRNQQAKALELRAAVSLSRLWMHNGRKKDAGHLLEDICGWFSQGHKSCDLEEAVRLIELQKA